MKLIIFVWMLVLAGCGQNQTDLSQYVNQIKQSPVNPLEPLAAPKTFIHVSFNVTHLRSPFGVEFQSPQQLQMANNCQVSAVQRIRQPLEKFALSSLKIVGVLKAAEQLNLLVYAPDAKVYRVTKGQYMGLNQGQLIYLDTSLATLQEWVTDSAGCLQSRTTNIAVNIEE
ncbi:pilus assembly protein PilP [Paraferrimonas sp. SM1919]|uniref:pilus assembly protein PilP n=1 Tax=Paraferrimonas sp. SM1919 TaxID=2662263 RepID=UPI0013D20618|nr:pilus assembly protein PilP [Paraferrimonas sp. SM1919]